MKQTFFLRNYLPDLIFILGVGFFYFSCVASTTHTAKTLEPGQGSIGAGYMQVRSGEEPGSEPVQLMGFHGRYGVSRGFDLGTEYTLDLSKGNENGFATIWVDGKIQLTNRDNRLLKPILATGLMKGYSYNAEVHGSSLPLMLSLPLSNKLTTTLIYRWELFSESFIPSAYDPRHTFAAGLEFGKNKADHTKWNPKIAFSLGMLNGALSEEWNPDLIFNIGMKIESPYKLKDK
jgi:hypothetical protein